MTADCRCGRGGRPSDELPSMRRAPSSFCSSSSAASSGSRRVTSEVSLPASASMSSSSSSRCGGDGAAPPVRVGPRCRGARFTANLPVHAERVLERLPDDIGVALLHKPFGQRRRLVAEHQGVALDGAHDRTRQHHVDGAAALTNLLAHGGPHAAHRGRIEFAAHRSARGRSLHHRVGRRPQRRGRRRRPGAGSASALGTTAARLGAASGAAAQARVAAGLALAGELLRRRADWPTLRPHRPEWTCPAASRCARRVAAAPIRCRWPTAAAAARTPPRAAAAARSRRASHRARRAPPRRSGSASRRRSAWPGRASAPARPPARRPRRGRLRRAPTAARSDRGSARADRWRTVAGRGRRRSPPRPRRTAPRRPLRPARRPHRRSARRRWRPAAPAPAGTSTRFPSAPASSWSSTDSVSRGEPPPARMTSGYTASSTDDVL